MSSPNHTEKASEEVSSKVSMIFYTFDKETRQKISACRQRYKGPIYKETIAYPPKTSASSGFSRLYLCNQTQKETIEQRILEADAAMKEIYPDLRAAVDFLPLDAAEIGRGALYEQIADSIKYKVLDQAFKRLEHVVLDENSVLTPRTKVRLRKMVDQLDALNILEDEDVAAKIASIRQKIEDEAIMPLKGELADDLKTLKGRFHALEF
ncbi:MAG TPA: hypothetical protein VJY40_01675 [Corynebacterium sp.]|nr:hypothetical protein [Corynebacterium sp.]